MKSLRRLTTVERRLGAGRIPAAERFKVVFSDEELEVGRDQIIAQYGVGALRQITFIVFEDPFAEYR